MVKNKTNSLNDKLDLILNNQKKILKNEQKILGEEQKIEELEIEEIEDEQKIQIDEKSALDELANLETELKKNITNPLTKVTKRDFFKGFIGAFVGVISHFAFSYAAKIAKDLSFLNATVLYFVALLMIILMLYYSGFRKIEKNIVLKFMPIRVLALYSVSIITIILVNLLFGKIHFPISFSELYILISASIILAVMGAGTADLIGKNED